MRVKNHFIFYYLSVMIISCDSSNYTRTYNLPKQKLNNLIQQPNDNTSPSEITWKKPDKWKSKQGSSMRLVSFSIPYSRGFGDLSVIKLSGDAGGFKANVNRWRKQLNLPPQNKNEIEKNLIRKNGKLGTFRMIKIINHELDSAFICSIIPYKNETIFVKASLNSEGLSEIIEDFIRFCSSIINHH